ncbi:probable serine/threonine-protein kinase nek3 [Uranotaenia lowii]|uniref:probable serine/threonine-protein kinase nek3 n=1 Tax=Uranotaenia lowii TaxID=190385 RepID=UPI0024790FA5|nr:probable serine/threonine-protein kinase nek3 [Uranotaenia lowii]
MVYNPQHFDHHHPSVVEATTTTAPSSSSSSSAPSTTTTTSAETSASPTAASYEQSKELESIDDCSSNSSRNNNNNDSPASSPTGTSANTPSSSMLFGAPVFVGHSPHSAAAQNEPVVVQQQQQVLVKSSLGSTTTNAIIGRSRIAAGVAPEEQKQPLHTQSHSNDGTESTTASSNSIRLAAAAGGAHHLQQQQQQYCGSGTTTTTTVGAAAKGTTIGAGGGGGGSEKYAAIALGAGVSAGTSASGGVDSELTRSSALVVPSGETNSYSEIGWKLKKNTSSASSSASPNNNSSNNNSSNGSSSKMVAASAEEITYEKSRFVGVMGNTADGGPLDVDTTEELKYGPGIVSKLRCRYLSLALRQSVNKQRPSLNSMRRATSLNNLLDEESEDLSEREQSIDGKDSSQDKSYHGRNGRDYSQSHVNLQHQQKAKTPDEYISTFQKNVQNSYTRSGRQTEKKNEHNRYNKQRGADSLKRARSVEALVRYDHKAWERDIQKENLYSSNDSNVIILDEISNGNGINTNGGSNNCQTVAMSKADLIVDCVTIEEKIINGREKGDPKPKRLTSYIDADERPPPDVVKQTMKLFEANANRRGRTVARTNGAAGEVAAKVNLFANYKTIISQEKPPITHPKPPLSPKKPNIIPRSTSPKSNGTLNGNGLAKPDKPNLPKLDINTIRHNLESTNNLKNSATPPTTPSSNAFGGSIQNNTSTPLSVRVESSTTTYRLKNNDSPALSPNAVVPAVQYKINSTTTTITTQPESPRSSASPSYMQNNNANSTVHPFAESPSIQALASKLSGLSITTSTPTSTRSPTPSVESAVPPQVPPRNIGLQYATSEEDTDDDPDDRQCEYSINSERGSDGSQADDLELDEEPDSPKKISRSAMDNIAKAGVTTQFRFNNGQPSKSHLPSLGTGNSNNNTNNAAAKLLSSKKLNVDDHHHHHQSSNSSSTSSSPITVPAAAVVTQKPPVPLSRESLHASKVSSNNNSLVSVSTSSSSNLNNLNSINANNTSVNSNKSVINEGQGSSSDVKTVVSLTPREIEKNQINLEKSEESIINSAGAAASSGGVSVGVASAKPNNLSGVSGGIGGLEIGAGVDGPKPGTATGAAAGDFFMAKWGGQSAAAPAATAPVVAKKKVKAPPPPITETNTMVFNFSDRKDVPDYIENDGVILRPRPRELPKPGESGFVVLGDLTLETSTDPDDSWVMGPPSPCDVEFANANIVINGKSSLRNKTSRDSKFKIQFDDSLTSTFEYPSETSLLETNDFDDEATPISTTPTSVVDGGGGGGGGGGGLAFGDNSLLSHKNNLLSSMPLAQDKGLLVAKRQEATVVRFL